MKELRAKPCSVFLPAMRTNDYLILNWILQRETPRLNLLEQKKNRKCRVEGFFPIRYFFFVSAFSFFAFLSIGDFCTASLSLHSAEDKETVFKTTVRYVFTIFPRDFPSVPDINHWEVPLTSWTINHGS